MHTFSYLLCLLLFLGTFPLIAQDNPGTVDRSDIYWGETVKRENIEAGDLPTEVLKGFETSEYSDMDMMEVHKIVAKPMKDSEDPYRTVPENIDILDTAYQNRPYRMREENNDIAQTYYQDTYDNVESLSDSLIVDDAFKDKKNTYYEIEVSGNVASYKLLFTEQGDIRNAKIMDK